MKMLSTRVLSIGRTRIGCLSGRMQMTELTPRQRRFCEEYLVDLNASAAARRAGYSVTTAYSIGQENLKKPEIATEIQRRMEARSKRTEITADQVVTELGKIAFANMLNYMTIQDDGTAVVDFSMVDRDQGAVMREVTIETYAEGRGEDAQTVKRIKFALYDKKGALELLGRHFGLFTDKLEAKLEVQGEDPASVLAARRMRREDPDRLVSVA
jgi:phage terminase small subunit